MDYLQIMNFNTIDANGFKVGSINPSVVSDLNRNSVVEDQIPDTPLTFPQRWRWVSGQWTPTADYRGHVWYNPANTAELHEPTEFDDAPPADWVYWVPGENKIVPESELIENQWVLVRSIRAKLLGESDWVVTKAVEAGLPVDPEWVAYRQGLRDITDQADPFFILWPTKPGTDIVIHEDIREEFLGQEEM
jgi:hypothetical protein